MSSKDIDRQFIDKWNKDYKNNKIELGTVKKWSKNQVNFEAKNRKFELLNGNVICVEKCLVCNKIKIVSPTYFYFKKNIYYESGKEICLNSLKQGCIECSKKYKKKISEEKEEYVRRLLSKYIKLNLNWYNSTTNNCAISNILLVEKSNSEWRVSIQNNIPNLEHLPENCIKIAFEFNVAEHNSIETDLIKTYKECIFPSFVKELTTESDTTNLVNYVIKWYNNSSKENGVNYNKNDKYEYIKNLYKFNLRSILSKQVNTYKNIDKKRKLNSESSVTYITADILFNKLIKQNMKCFYTGIPFSIYKDEWNYWSLERIDNNKNHNDNNTVFICRIFNTYGGLNRKKLLYALINQIHISLPEEIKKKIDYELNFYK